MTKFDGEEFVYGYPKDELMLFALACREAGITNEKLHEITFDIKWAITVLKAEIEKEVIGSLASWIDKIAEQTEPMIEQTIGNKATLNIKNGVVKVEPVYEQTEPNSSEKPNNCDEPTWEQVKEYCNKRCLDIVDSAMRKQWYKDEPQTERYCTNCKHNGVIADYECRECCGMDHHEFIEPQTDCAWMKGE